MCSIDYLQEMLMNFQKSIFGTDYRIYFHDGITGTDGNNILLRKPTEINMNTVKTAYSSMIHEVFHCKYGTYDIYEGIKKKSLSFKKAFNTIEDYRVDTLGTFEFPGAGRYHHTIMQDRITRGEIGPFDMYSILLCDLFEYKYMKTLYTISVDNYKLAKARSIIYNIPLRPKEDVLLVSEEIEKLFEVKNDKNNKV